MISIEIFFREVMKGSLLSFFRNNGRVPMEITLKQTAAARTISMFLWLTSWKGSYPRLAYTPVFCRLAQTG